MTVFRVFVSGLAAATFMLGGASPGSAAGGEIEPETSTSVSDITVSEPEIGPITEEIDVVLESTTPDGAAPVPGSKDLDDAVVTAAATSCGSRTVPADYGITVFGNYYKSVVHTSGLSNCRRYANITSASVSSHSCNKYGWWTIANSITKSRNLGATGVPQSTSLFECNFHGGAQIKGVGIGITRDLYTRITAYVSSGTLWHRWSVWDSCC